jgi:deubiquitinase DESI2
LGEVVRDASDKFQGSGYNLLTRNCNHFTSYLCEKLTGKSAPRWLNRAASIGVALPCVVPREWIEPPDVETADGMLVEDEDEELEAARPADERTAMLRRGSDYSSYRSSISGSISGSKDGDGRRVPSGEQKDWDTEMDRISQTSPPRRKASRSASRTNKNRDTSGRTIPVTERAPVPR